MKKILKALCLATILLLPLVGCNDNPESGADDITIQKQIDAGDGDLKNATVSEDVVISKAITLRNADFDGHTITVNADTTLIDIRNAHVVIAGTNTEIEKAITLKISGNSTITSITVKTENAKIASSGDKVTITSLEIGSEAKNVDISGGQITTLSVVFTDSETSKNVLNISGGVKIANTKAITESGTDVTKSIYVTITDEKTEKPNGVQSLDVKSVRLIKGTNVKTTYEVGDSFDFTDLSIEVTYSNDSTKTLQLSETNIKVSGFSYSTTGNKTVSFIYADVPVSGTLSVTVNAPKEGSYADLLNKAVENFADLKLDEGIANIKGAYELEKNDTTTMYYALATLALVSTNNDTVNFMKNTCGFTSYPNTLNALICPFIDWEGTPWFEDCFNEGFVERVVAANPQGFNTALNKIVKIVENAYNEVNDISKDMGQDPILLPAKLIEVLNLDEILGAGVELQFNKAQLDMIIAYVGIIKGVLQYVSALDWIFDTSSIKTDMDVDDFITAVQTGTNLFTVTNESVLAKSKESFVTSVDLIMSAWNTVVENSSAMFPPEATDILQAYDILYKAAKALKDALEKNGTFYVPDSNIFELTEWPTTDTSDWLVKIDCGKMFSKDVLDGAIEKDASGKVKFYTQYYYDYGYGYNSGYSTPSELNNKFASVYQKNRDTVETNKPDGVTYYDCYTYLCIKVKLPAFISIKGIEENDRTTFYWVWDEYFDSYDDCN